MLWCAIGEYGGPRTVKAFTWYVGARLSQYQREMAYRIYVTDCLKNISENAATVSKMNGGEGRYINTRFYDVLNPKPEETRTGAEIIADLRRKLAVN